MKVNAMKLVNFSLKKGYSLFSQLWSFLRLSVHASSRSQRFWLPRTTTKTSMRVQIANAPALNPETNSDTDEDGLFPPVTRPPKYTYVSSLPHFDRNSCELIVFDLETTSLRKDSEICQLAAMRVSDETVWSTYVLPTCSIDPGASLVTGLVVRYAGNDRYLTHYGKRVRTSPSYKDSIWAFCNHLRELSRHAKHLIFIGYNSKVFDVPILCNSFRDAGISAEKLDRLGLCFVDSYSYLKSQMKTRDSRSDKDKLNSTTLSNVYESLFGEGFRAHNAVSDVQALSRILFKSSFRVSPSALIEQATTAGSAFSVMEYNEQKRRLLKSMEGQLFSEDSSFMLKSPISRYMACKMATSGLGYEDLEKIYKHRGRIGISDVCQMPICSPDGKRVTSRVTSNERVIEAIVRHFKEKHS